METSDLLRIIGLLVLFGFRIFLATSETALLASNRLSIKHMVEEERPRAKLLSTLLERPNRFLPTILLLTLLVDVGAAAIATTVALKYIPFGAAIATGVITILLFIYTEMIPKTFVIYNPEKMALRLSPAVSLLTSLFYPVAFLFIQIANVFTKILGGKTIREGPFVTEEEIKTLVSVGKEEGVIEEEEKEMIHHIFEFGDTITREVMVPRMDIVSAANNSSLKEVLDLVIKEGHSRIPIYEDTIDNITGIVYAKDLLVYLSKGKEGVPINKLVHRAYYIPETKRVSELLRELQKKRQHMAIVVDEYGGTAGLITIEDLLEEIVGEIFDEYDLEEIMIEHVDESNIRVDARVNLDEINEVLDLDLPEAEYETIGGFVYSLVGKIPTAGEKINYNFLTFTVEKVEKRRISKILITKHPGNDEDRKEKEKKKDKEKEKGERSG